MLQYTISVCFPLFFWENFTTWRIFLQKMKKKKIPILKKFLGKFGPFLEIKRIKLVTSTIQVPNPLR